MIEKIKEEINFLKLHNLQNTPWKETSMQLIKRLTGEIKVDDPEKKKALLSEIYDFLARGKGNDDSFDFIYPEDDTYFQEIHIYHIGNNVIARIDRTEINPKGSHSPVENIITIEYIEAEEHKLEVKNIKFMNEELDPTAMNLIFAENMFAKIAGDIVSGEINDSKSYQTMGAKIMEEIPDLYATPEQRERMLKRKGLKANFHKSSNEAKKEALKEKIHNNGFFVECLLLAIDDINLDKINTEGLTEEEIFYNLINKLRAEDDEERIRLQKEAKEFFDAEYGDNSFDLEKKVKNGSIHYQVAKDYKNNKIEASVKGMIDGKDVSKKYNKNKKIVYFFEVLRMTYEEDPNNPGEYIMTDMNLMGKNCPVEPQWQWLGERYYNYLIHESMDTTSVSLDLEDANNVLTVLANPHQSIRYIQEDTLEKIHVLSEHHQYIDDPHYMQQQQLKKEEMKKKYEQLYGMKLELK